MEQKRSLSIPRLIFGITFLMAMAAAVWFVLSLLTPRVPELTTSSATIVDPPRQIEPFLLTGTDGEPVGLDDLTGNYTLLSFGYTHCPDVCPLTLNEYRRVKRDLGESGVDVNFVLVSVDGERDTPEVLGQYLDRFDPTFIGMTTDDVNVLDAVTDNFSVLYERREVSGTQSAYLVDHTASTFLLDPRGRLIALYPFGTPPSDIAQDLNGLL